MTMSDQPPFDAAQVTADLESGDAARVAAALETLDHAWRRRTFVPLPLPSPDCLAAFGDAVPLPLVERYLRVLENYVDFDPTPSGPELRRALVDAMLRFSRGQLAHPVALAVRVDPSAADAAADVLEYLRDRDVDGADELRGAIGLVDALLDSDKTRAATVEGMRYWAMMGRFAEIIDAVRPRLDAAERARLAVDEEG